MGRPVAGRILVAAGFFCGLALHAAMARSSDEDVAVVVQPLLTSGAGNIVTPVTYIGYEVDRRDPVGLILLTTRPNLVWCNGKAEDRNGAAREGIRFEREERRPEEVTATDTLQVIVDLSTFAKGAQHPDRYDEELLTATLWCGLRNAKAGWPEVRFVRYAIEGSAVFASYSGIYALERIPAVEGPEQRARSGPAALRP